MSTEQRGFAVTPLDEILRLDTAEPRLSKVQECQRDLNLIVSCLAIMARPGLRVYDDGRDTTAATLVRRQERRVFLAKRLERLQAEQADGESIARLWERRSRTPRTLH